MNAPPSSAPAVAGVEQLVDCLRYRPVATTAAQMREAAGLIERLREALTRAEVFFSRPDESASGHYDRIADAFQRATGYMMPGKDESMHSAKPLEERQAAYDKWLADERAFIRAALGETP